jgi:hypothetical protein
LNGNILDRPARWHLSGPDSFWAGAMAEDIERLWFDDARATICSCKSSISEFYAYDGCSHLNASVRD